MQVFTPLNETKTKRLRFKMDDVRVLSGSLDTRKLGIKAIVKIKNKTYSVYGCSCGLENCNCDAYIKLIKG